MSYGHCSTPVMSSKFGCLAISWHLWLQVCFNNPHLPISPCLPFAWWWWCHWWPTAFSRRSQLSLFLNLYFSPSAATAAKECHSGQPSTPSSTIQTSVAIPADLQYLLLLTRHAQFGLIKATAGHTSPFSWGCLCMLFSVLDVALLQCFWDFPKLSRGPCPSLSKLSWWFGRF